MTASQEVHVPDGLKKLGLSLGIAILMCIPVYIFIAANLYFDPSTFWEKAAMICLAYVFLGGLQLWLLIIGIAAILTVWYE